MFYEEIKKFLIHNIVHDESELHSFHFLAMGGAAKAIS
jgi:hypothetical protein